MPAAKIAPAAVAETVASGDAVANQMAKGIASDANQVDTAVASADAAANEVDKGDASADKAVGGEAVRSVDPAGAEAVASIDVASMRKELEMLKTIVAQQGKEIAELKQQTSHEFIVAQYNILAGYLGDNCQPWFLYGIDVPAEKRAAIMQKFYERVPETGKFANVGWPNYVEGILTDEEKARVCAVNDSVFAWERRKDALIKVITGLKADLLSLVECDHFEDFFEPEMSRLGYAAAYKKRPRDVSQDGCAIFWRRGVFQLLGQTSLEFIDRMDKEGRPVKDRVALVCLLRHCSGHRVIVVSTHLARNPEDPRQTSSRAKQTAQLLKGLTDFAASHSAMQDPVLLAGDLNTTNIRQIANIARAVFELASEEVHPFIFTANAPRSMPTSVTTTRKMCIDYLFLQSSLEVTDWHDMEQLSMDRPIPDSEHPSDHLPLVFTIRFRKNCSRRHGCVISWTQIVLALSAGAEEQGRGDVCTPLTLSELEKAFQFFDVEGDGKLSTLGFETGLVEVSMGHLLGRLIGNISTALGDNHFGPDSPLIFEDFVQVYLLSMKKQKTFFGKSLVDAFSYFDTSGDGYLEQDELYASFCAVCPFHVDKDKFANDIFKRLDANGDGTRSLYLPQTHCHQGRVSCDEFVEYLLTSHLSPKLAVAVPERP